MIIKQISASASMTMPGRQQFSSRKFEGSVTCDIESGEDIKEAFRKAWLIARSQILSQMNLTIPTQETKIEQEVIEKQLAEGGEIKNGK